MAAPVTDAEWLTWVARLMESSAALERAPHRTPEGYRCLLDEQPTHLLPERLLRQLPGDEGRNLRFNPRCHLPGGEVVPEPLRAAVKNLCVSCDSNTQVVVWIEHAGTWTPFWLSASLTATVRAIREDPARLPGLATGVRKTLCQAGILVAADSPDDRLTAWAQTVERTRVRFHERGYAPIAGLIHPFHVAALRAYVRRLIRKGAMRLGDGQSPRRYIAHNDPAARFFHMQLTNVVSDLVSQPVKPSYVYMAAYQSGARLENHTDREQCEFSITLCLDYSPEPTGATPWPLRLDTGDGTVTVYQALGDGLLYRGRALPHHRGTLAEGNTSTSIFFHYVAEDFTGPLE